MTNTALTDLRFQVFELVKNIPKGKVSTYKQLAQAVGTHPRVIGRVLHTNTDPDTYPCHRVIKTNGTLAKGYAFGGPHKQQTLLEVEGIVFKNGRVDLDTYLQ